MIPVRISAAARPPRATDMPRLIAADHPLAEYCCPVCDEPYSGREVYLVVVGCPGAVEALAAGKAWLTGAAVAVHVECALPGEVTR